MAQKRNDQALENIQNFYHDFSVDTSSFLFYLFYFYFILDKFRKITQNWVMIFVLSSSRPITPVSWSPTKPNQHLQLCFAVEPVPSSQPPLRADQPLNRYTHISLSHYIKVAQSLSSTLSPELQTTLMIQTNCDFPPLSTIVTTTVRSQPLSIY